jgi:SOS-response transcriptional repressor LexA
MHSVQAALLKLSKKTNLAQLSLREMASAIGMPTESPQKIKHHLLQLQKKRFLSIDKAKGMMSRSVSGPGLVTGLLKKTANLFSIPIIGTANAGPAEIFAEQNFQGFLRVSSRLINRKKPDGLYAIRVSGSSMNLSSVHGKPIEDGDLVIVDSTSPIPSTGDVVLAIVDNKATIKKFLRDDKNDQIVLKAESSLDYEPIYIHSSDAFSVSGKVIGVIKKASSE